MVRGVLALMVLVCVRKRRRALDLLTFFYRVLSDFSVDHWLLLDPLTRPKVSPDFP